jgi:hypothetical protein
MPHFKQSQFQIRISIINEYRQKAQILIIVTILPSFIAERITATAERVDSSTIMLCINDFRHRTARVSSTHHTRNLYK